MRSGYLVYRMVGVDEVSEKQSRYGFSVNCPKFQGRIETDYELDDDELEDELRKFIKKKHKEPGIYMTKFWNNGIVPGTTKFHDMRGML